VICGTRDLRKHLYTCVFCTLYEVYFRWHAHSILSRYAVTDEQQILFRVSKKLVGRLKRSAISSKNSSAVDDDLEIHLGTITFHIENAIIANGYVNLFDISKAIT
ncbi:unnamed protein product, partial [Heterotrigona itama]